MREVYVVGVAQVPVRRGAGAPVRALGAEVVRGAIAHADVGAPTALFVGNMLAGSLSDQRQLGALLADASGLRGVEATRVEAACASGSAALRAAVLAIGSGAHDVVVAAGVEAMSHADKTFVTRSLATASDWEAEGAHGATFLSLNATLMRAYLDRYRLPEDALAPFARTAHDNARLNPNALFHKAISLEDYRAARVIAPPLRLFDVSPVCDGAAAVVLASREAKGGGPRVRVAGSAVATDTVALAERADPLRMDAARASVAKVYAQARIEPRHVDLFEVHDAYTVMAALALEAAGFVDGGAAPAFAAEGRIARHGDVPIATMGGLKARGHPVGATGVYQAVEAYQQLTGTASELQVPDARIAMLQGFGGTAATVITHLFERVG